MDYQALLNEAFEKVEKCSLMLQFLKQRESHNLKTGRTHIPIRGEREIRPEYRTSGVMKVMHGPGMGAQDLLMQKIWEDLDDDQKRALITRMIDAKILMKENMIKYMEFKIETFRKVRDMIAECD